MAGGQIELIRQHTTAVIIAAVLAGVLGYRIGIVPMPAAGADPGAQTCDPADAAPSVWRCFYVAANGSDQNPGTLNAPLATIDAAKARARTFSPDWRGDVLIAIRGGTYHVRQTIVFDPSDSGKNGHRLIVRPFRGEAVRISGGQRVRTWSGPVDGGIYWSTDLPKVVFRHLTVNGRRAPRARHPNGSDFHTIAAWDKPGDAIKCPEKSGRRLGIFDQDAWFVASLSREALSQVEVFVERYHGSAIVRIASVGPANEGGSGVRYVVPKEPERGRLLGPSHGCLWQIDKLRYHFESSIAFLDEPREWFLDTTTGTPTLYFIPSRGKTPADLEIVAPVLETLVRFRGTANQRVRNVVIQGLQFTDTTWVLPNTSGFVASYPGVDYRDNTGGWDTYLHPAAIHLEGTEQVIIQRNVLRALGGAGISLSDHTRKTIVDGNAILEVAGIGIAVDGQGFVGRFNDAGYLPFPPAGKPRSDGDRISNNRIQRFGIDYWASAGVAAAYPWSVTFEHNEISDGYGMGLSLGWYGNWSRCHTFTDPGMLPPLPPDKCESSSGSNRVIGNRIFAVASVTQDVGGLYTLGHQSPFRSFATGLQIRRNHVFGPRRPETWGASVFSSLYVDGDTSFTIVADNIFERPQGPSATAIFLNPDAQTSVPPHDIRWTDKGDRRRPGSNVSDPSRRPDIRDSAGLSPAYKNVPRIESQRPSR